VTPVPEFTPRSWSPIEEGGWLALMDCDREWNRDDPGLVGPVNVAGKVYECLRVERTLSARPVIHAGETMGLLLKDAPQRPPADRIVSP
jgi:hypothetical protein